MSKTAGLAARVEGEADGIMIQWIIIPQNGLAMEGTPRSFMWNRIEKLESAIEDRLKIAQAGREIAKFIFVKAITDRVRLPALVLVATLLALSLKVCVEI